MSGLRKILVIGRIPGLILFLLAGTMGLTSCFDCVEGSGPLVVEERECSEVTEIELSGSAEVILVPSSSPFLHIEAPQDIQEYVVTEFKGNRLRIGTSKCIRSKEDIVITAGLPDLSAVSLTGSGTIRSMGLFNTDELVLSISGSGMISLEVSSSAIETGISGSGDVVLRGFTDFLDISITGSGDTDALECQADEAVVGISGSGSAFVNVTRRLEAEIYGSGDVRYLGEPDVDASIHGSGTVSKTH